ncbi:LITAF-like zinc ribbon domain-containing protein [Ditylenchus destructor]|uniref:LITAF-like zinc ribbon domain-containing protein n=1 Tax=Ditylenchus destructor TaxID=166010 RepID=A0AAD4NFR0_9BILA|nr:LITAF-like zinc ribbon domain-containing protein [Ditylenchus destructor]
MDPPPPYATTTELKYNNGHLLPGVVPEPTAPSAHNSIPPPPMMLQQGIVYAIPLGPSPAGLQCANCQAQVVTKIIQRPGLLTWLICGALALIGFWPCCVIPFCVKSCHDVEHYCPQCNAFIGMYKRI